MKIERTPTVVTVKETPGCMWFLAAFFIFVGALFVYGASGGYNNYAEMSYFLMAVHILLGTCAVAAGVWLVYVSPKVLVKVDRNTETVSVRQTRLGGSSVQTFRFDDVTAFNLFEETDSDGDPVWSLQLETSVGDPVRCSSFASSDRQFTTDVAFELTAFMYKQMPSYRQVDELEGESPDRIS